MSLNKCKRYCSVYGCLSKRRLGDTTISFFKIPKDVERAILMTGASLTASVFVMQVAVLPLLFKYSKSVQRKIVFSNCINFPRNLNYESPSSVNIVGGRNLNIEFQSKVDDCPIKIGIWHIIPRSMFRQVFIHRDTVTLETELIEELKTTRKTVVLYCHGPQGSLEMVQSYKLDDSIACSKTTPYSLVFYLRKQLHGCNSNHRASPHRLQMYKVFQELDFHIITFDYRGYGDSSHVRPTERGVVEDCLHVYSWLISSLDAVHPPTIVLWGHSLGTAVASNMVAHMTELCQHHGMPLLPPPDVLVLEAPFNNLTDEIASHPFSKLVSWLPYYKETFVKPFSISPEFSFTTDQYLAKAPHVPTLMLHCKGDKIVPYELAVKLYESVRSSRGRAAAPLVFHSFERGLGLGHNNICEANDLQIVVRNFLTLTKKNFMKEETTNKTISR